jgi:hypothetical protein
MTGRVMYRDRGDMLRMTIAPKVNALQLLIVLASLSPFLFFLFRFIQNMRNAMKGGSPLPLLGGLLVWGISGIFWLYSILVNVFGKEIVTITRETLSIRKSFMGRGPERAYHIGDISQMRIYGVHTSAAPFIGQFIQPGVSIVFKYGGKTIRFANQLLEREARFMLDRLKSKLPPSAFKEA